MSLIQSEKLISLSDAVQHLPNPPHPATVYRWLRTGLRGICLETVKVGGRRYTSREALERFIAKLSQGLPAA